MNVNTRPEHIKTYTAFSVLVWTNKESASENAIVDGTSVLRLRANENRDFENKLV